jgi:hypothetical protein
MAQHAARIVSVARNADHIDLDYSVARLAKVDSILGRIHDSGRSPAHIGTTLFAFGAYIGEVAVRNAGGHWVELPPEHPLGAGLAVDLPNHRLMNPIGKAFKRVEHGPGDGIPYFYYVLVEAPSAP